MKLFAKPLAALLFVHALVVQAKVPIERGSLVPIELDAATFDQWLNGATIPVPAEKAKTGPASVVWTANTDPWIFGVRFGEGREPGTRHLRIGLAKPARIGSVLVRGGGSLSVLKADAAYPGDIADDKQWIAASRLKDGTVTQAAIDGGSYGLWLLPPGTTTRALRFTHTPSPGDREMSGSLGGVWLHEKRLLNIAPQAIAQSRARDDASAKLIDERHNDWATWDNGEQGAALKVDESHPEFITLTWPRAVTLGGVCLLWNGFDSAAFDAFTGPDDASVREAAETQWRKVAEASKLESLYPFQLAPHWVSFDKPVNTRSLRVRITGGARSGHPHLASHVKEGRRVWLGELMAVTPVSDDMAPASFVLPRKAGEPPPIPVRFKLDRPGRVTLVIEDLEGRRVRNLVSETPFPAGENTAWWDGSDDLLRDTEAAKHGLYHIPTRMVAPGSYLVRGLAHDPLKLRYEFSLYNAGKPAWTTADNTGCWMTNHTAPASMAALPGSRRPDGKPLVIMGSFVSEGGHGLQWIHEDGTKIGGQGWVGGVWTGAPTLAVDHGRNAIPEHACYVGSIWEGEMRLTAKTLKMDDKPVFKAKLGDDTNKHGKERNDAAVLPLEGFDGGERVFVLSALGAHDGMLVCSMIRQNELLFVDAREGKISRRVSVKDPRGVAFDAKGSMLVLSGTRLLRFASMTDTAGKELITGFEDPRHVALDHQGRIHVSDRGRSHQVKVFSPEGKPERAIGIAGSPGIGRYEPRHMNNPNGIAIDSQGRLWVAEADHHPKRVSVWSPNGDLLRAFHGPSEYGGGGVLDSRDAGLFFYRGLEFKLDWKKGTDELSRIFYRPDPLLKAHFGPFSPDYPLYPGRRPGTRYFTSCFTHNPVSGDDAAFIWRDDGDSGARLVAGAGDAHQWAILRGDTFRPRWPEGTKPSEDNPQPDKRVFFIWSDANHDGLPQPEEVLMTRQNAKGITVTGDLAFVVTRFGPDTVLFAPSGFTPKGTPTYELKPLVIGPAGGLPPSSGGNQTLHTLGAWTIHANAPRPFSPHGLGGSLNGQPRWSYPSPWPGLHASHEAAVPDQPGQVIGHTRLLGDCIQSKVGPIFGINGNMGNMYLFTADGLFVSTLFHDIRLRPNWAAPVAMRNMDVTDVSLHDENFWPSMTQTPDGKVFVIDGARTSLVRVDGLDTLQRLPDQKINITAKDIDNARAWFDRVELERQRLLGSGILKVARRESGPIVDGNTDDWPADTEWAHIDRRGTRANFNSSSRPYEASAAVMVTGTQMFAAWRTTEKDLLNNTGETENAPFKHGGCLDIMLATDPEAKADRSGPVPGDQRLLVTLVRGKPLALLYRAKVPGTASPVPFSSPSRTIHIDIVEDVTSQVRVATNREGHYEIGLPLAALRWQPKSGTVYRADIGLLRGRDGQTTQRVYWSNKATAITADVPSEAELAPRLWGKWKVE